MRLLVTAFSLCPGEGSEPGVGWHSVRALAEEHEVHALVDANWEAKVRAVFQPDAHPRIHLHFVGVPVLSEVIGKLHNSLAWLLYYYLWQFAAVLVGLRLHRERPFDGAQHVTYVKCNVPSGLALLPMPLVFGPVGGGEMAPACFYSEFGWKTRFAEAARVALLKLAHFDPILRLCIKRSTLCIGTTPESAYELRLLGAGRVEVLPAVALSSAEIASIDAACTARRTSRDELTLLYVGRLIAWKGVHLGLRAIARAQDKRLRYRIIGDGPLRMWLQAEAHRLGIADRVEFAGALPREEVLKAYATADGFLYPSLHDSGGNAVIEAMCASLPILCLQFGGPALITGGVSGWCVPATSPEEAVAGLTEALNRFASDPDKRLERGRAARSVCLKQFSWEHRGQRLRALWERTRAFDQTET